jgi:hypothetical protein
MHITPAHDRLWAGASIPEDEMVCFAMFILGGVLGVFAMAIVSINKGEDDGDSTIQQRPD